MTRSKTLVECIIEIATFWITALGTYIRQKSDKDLLLETLQHARIYEEWEAAAHQLDAVDGDNELWRDESASKEYDYRLIHARTMQVIDAFEREDVDMVAALLRSGLVRNLGNIASPRLYNRAYAGTKLLIEDYVAQMALAVRFLATTDRVHAQQKMDMLHHARMAFGRTCLVMRGGSVFGWCHLGVVKALNLRGLLPRIVLGTATGALMAALVCVYTEDELPEVLSGQRIDIVGKASDGSIWERAAAFISSGPTIDREALLDRLCEDVGDLTFAEAYRRTKRVLNMTVPAAGGVPTLLNYLTAPNALIWSAARASFTNSPALLRSKLHNGNVVPWNVATSTPPITKTTVPEHERDSPLGRVAELFNVNHFIVPQARPYIAPILAPSLNHTRSSRTSRVSWTSSAMHLVTLELQHRLAQLDSLGLLSPRLRRIFMDEPVPGPSWTLVPDVGFSDFWRLLGKTRCEEVEKMMRRGERCVWPAVCALKIRCAIEVELDRGYQLARRRKPFEPVDGEEEYPLKKIEARRRAASLGAPPEAENVECL
ncbi:hypothetical protein K470DRAFT_275050 [Piedraia hortae CBS 480.64]|uniref:PNPLA domain-containing protein n=1 Tax=Piedraia hortae CBS 480.64 TaxID=1314780 RepID=A0A6A7C6J6_9PEZI|nr:hypothetical protein K470DRAFT_275050 [Piedraia hortae CBS 480.64]